jgi:hypothetical protein
MIGLVIHRDHHAAGDPRERSSAALQNNLKLGIPTHRLASSPDTRWARTRSVATCWRGRSSVAHLDPRRDRLGRHRDRAWDADRRDRRLLSGGKVDGALMRFVDIVLSFPTILLLLVVAFPRRPGLGTRCS